MRPILSNPGTSPPPAGHYSHAAAGAGLVFIAGQLPVTPEGRRLGGESFDVQARQVLANVQAALEAAGTTVSQLLHVRVYLTDIEQWGTFNTIYAEWAGEHRPARAVVPVPALHFGLMIEVEAVALAGVTDRP
ncbi:MAG: RidA family protein [Rubrivivax sp.]|nr:RidA family protein [Rubrivivax sp.]